QIVQDVVNSCDLRIAFKIGEPQDQQYFADMSGLVNKSKAIVHSGSIAFTYYQDTLIGPKDLDSLEPGWFYAFLNGKTYLGYSPMLKDRRPVVIKWNDTTVTGIEAFFTGEKEGQQKGTHDNKDVIEVNISEIEEMLKKLSQVQEVDLSVQESNVNKAVKKEQNKESQVVYADTTKLAKSYNTGQYSVPLSPELIKFQEQYESFFQYRKDDFVKILNLLDEFGNAPSVSNPNNPKAQISLMTHSLNVARKSFELMKTMDMPQEEKEVKFLASLAHDIGKAIVSMDPLSTHYSKEEHQKATEEILRNKQISEDIIAATRHHGSGSDNIVVQADKEARQEEDNKLAITNTVKMKQSKGEILNRIIEIVDQTYSCVAIGTTIYIDQEILYSILEEVLGFQPSANDILQTYGWEPVAVKILQNKQLIITGTYFKIKERLSMEMQTKIAAKKQSPDYKMKGLQVEEKS
ncbi:MAG TPA: HD domain-containing protein, partial [Thermodesulfobium narugense]|nr:HD domain-containing protein [Thermodesulfobium narugense]